MLQKFALAPRHVEHPEKYATAEKQVHGVDRKRTGQEIPSEYLIKEDCAHAFEDVCGG